MVRPTPLGRPRPLPSESYPNLPSAASSDHLRFDALLSLMLSARPLGERSEDLRINITV